jgi:hypothetical protein
MFRNRSSSFNANLVDLRQGIHINVAFGRLECGRIVNNSLWRNEYNLCFKEKRRH